MTRWRNPGDRLYLRRGGARDFIAQGDLDAAQEALRQAAAELEEPDE
ncbi:MAG: hypothetical protein GY719_26110 [bacterium]|nr:hypothetical protein [bacterium]